MKQSCDVELSPLGFAEVYLGLSMYKWQAEALMPLEGSTGVGGRRTNISVKAPNGSGKDDRLIPAACYWWMNVHARGKVCITTKSDLQLKEQTLPSLDRHWPKFGWERPVYSPHYKLKSRTGGVLNAFVTNDAARVEGWHKEDDVEGPLLIILNEVKELDDEIFDAIVGRCTYNAIMLVSSTGLAQGRFYDTHTKNRHLWHCVSAGLVDCPHIPKERIEFVKASYGEGHPFTRSTLYGEFMEQDEANRYCLSVHALERCIGNPPPRESGRRVLFCDFAGGGDENVVALRDGNKITLEAHWREKDKLAAVGRFIQHFVRLRCTGDQIYGDAAQKDMCDLLGEAGWDIHRINFGSRPESKNYVSWGAMAWLELAKSIEKCEVILPDDETLKAQLTSRVKTMNRLGKLGVEDKFSMRKRNVHSPDRGDAVAGAWAVYSNEKPVYQRGQLAHPAGWWTSGEYVEIGETGEAKTLMNSIGADSGEY